MIEIPIRTGNGQNNREHWRVAARRSAKERATAGAFMPNERPALPCVITLIRTAPSSGLDAHDNLRGALKHVVDGIADWLGIKDNDPRVTWAYAQERGPWAVKVEVSHVPNP